MSNHTSCRVRQGLYPSQDLQRSGTTASLLFYLFKLGKLTLVQCVLGTRILLLRLWTLACYLIHRRLNTDSGVRSGSVFHFQGCSQQLSNNVFIVALLRVLDLIGWNRREYTMLPFNYLSVGGFVFGLIFMSAEHQALDRYFQSDHSFLTG